MVEGPEEVKAEQSHPAEHGQSGEVERVADGETRGTRDGNEELLGRDVGVIVDPVRHDLHVVADHEEAGGEEDEEDVGADNFTLQSSKDFFSIVINSRVTFCQYGYCFKT